jgi:hypothetical protein
MREFGKLFVFRREIKIMKKKRFTEAQIAFALREAKSGTPVE